MTHAARWPLMVGLGLVALAAGAAVARAQEVALAKPRFIATWAAPGEPADASGAATLQRRVSLDLTSVTVGVALSDIVSQARLDLSYDKSVLPPGRVVSLHVRDITVVAALTEVLLNTGVDVAVARGGHLALVKRVAALPDVAVPDTGAIVGRVTDKATGAPIVGATVVVEGTREAATTNKEGRYRVGGLEPATYSLRARYIGYAPRTAPALVVSGSELAVDFALEKAVQQLEQLVVTTPGGIQSEVKALPTPVSIIRESDIALQRPRTVQELFRAAVPGAVSWDNPARPADAAFSVRGASTFVPGTSQMKVFVDGVEAAYPTNAIVDPNSIDRIEVTRGPQAAAIYGADAIGGVIQIFTKHGDPSIARPQVDAQGAAGLVETPYPGFSAVLRQSYAASVRGGAPDASYTIGGGYSHLGDWLPNGEISSQSNPSLYGSTRLVRSILAVDVSGRYNVQNNPTVVNPAFNQTGYLFYSRPILQPTQIANQSAGVRLSLTPTAWWRHTVTIGIDRLTTDAVQSRARFTTSDDTLLSVSTMDFVKRSIGYNTSVQGMLGSNVSGLLTVGVDHYSLPQSSFGTSSAIRATGTITTGDGSPIDAYRLLTNNTGYFGQGQLGFRDALFVTFGLRAERNTNFGDSLGTPLSPRAGLSYVGTVGGTTLKVRGSWGRAIRPPDPALRLSLGPTIVPNLRLGPERQQGWDAGVDAAFGMHASLSVTGYHQTATNLIQFVQLPTTPIPLSQFQNVGRVKNTGIEIEGSLSLGAVQLKGTYGYTRARVEDLGPGYTGSLHVGDQVMATPTNTAGALLSATLRQGTTVTAGLAYIGTITQIDAVALFKCLGGTGACTPDFNFVANMPAFTKINAAITQQITRQLDAFLSIDNLANNDGSEGGNFLPAMGRISTLGIRAQL